jgi:tetratricopeptide (TPR) repeat protein
MAWLLPYTGLGQEERNRLSRAIHEQAQACAKAKQWSRAISLTELLIEGEKDNGDYQELLIFCTHSATMERMAALKAEPAAAELAKGISALEALRSRFPRQLAVFQALGTEHHLRAVQLANSHQLSLALDEAVRASAFDPEQDGLADTTKKLNEMMAQLQARVKDLLQEIRFRPNVRLSADGLRMKTQAERGFAPANQWAESAEASAVASARHEAYVSSIWRRVGLAPQAENAIGKAEALIAGLSQVIQAAPGSGPEIASEWERVSANISELADVDHEAVIRWLNRRLLADSVEPETPAPASGYPALRIAANPANKGEEDLQDWLVSPKGIRIKTQIAAACVFLLIAVFFAGSNVRSLSVRDAAWKQMQASAAASDDNGMVQAGELYFSTSSPAGEEKGRSEAAAEMYSRALVRWYAAHSSESADQAAARVNLFRVRVSNKGYLNANEAGGPQ